MKRSPQRLGDCRGYVLAGSDRPARVGPSAALHAGGVGPRDELVLASIVEA